MNPARMAQQWCKTEIRHRIFLKNLALLCRLSLCSAQLLFVSCSQFYFGDFFQLVGIVLFTIFIHKFIYLNMKKQLINEAKRLQELAGIEEVFNSFLDTNEGGYMREYIDSIAEEEGLDLSYKNDFDEAFKKALQQLQSENIYPELDFDAIVANKDSFWK
jgi:hypothetical protein